MSSKSAIIEIFKHRSRVCLISKKEEEYRGYVSLPKSRSGTDHEKIKDKINSVNLNFSGTIEVFSLETWFLGFTPKKNRDSYIHIKNKTIELADELIDSKI